MSVLCRSVSTGRTRFHMSSDDHQDWTFHQSGMCFWGSPGWWAIKAIPSPCACSKEHQYHTRIRAEREQRVAAAAAAVAEAAAAPGSKCAMVYTLSGEANEIMFEPGEQVTVSDLVSVISAETTSPSL